MDTADSTLLAAWVQTGAAIAQALAAGAALWASYKLAAQSHAEARQREAEQDAQRIREQEDAAGALLLFLKISVQQVQVERLLRNTHGQVAARENLRLLIDRANALPVDLLSKRAAVEYLDSIRIAVACHTRVARADDTSERTSDGTNLFPADETQNDVDKIKDLLDIRLAEFERALGRDIVRF